MSTYIWAKTSKTRHCFESLQVRKQTNFKDTLAMKAWSNSFNKDERVWARWKSGWNEIESGSINQNSQSNQINITSAVQKLFLFNQSTLHSMECL